MSPEKRDEEMGPFPLGRVVFFVTSNVHKFDEARKVLAECKVAAAMLRVEAVEIQDDSIRKVAKASASDAVEKCGLPIIVEDAGLFIETLKGFPGPYSSYAYRTIGTRGILELMKNVDKREAYFRSVVAFSSPDEPTMTFQGKINGKISRGERGRSGFGFDPIFSPSGQDRTFAEMTTEEKNRYSHRAQALRRFAQWYMAAFKP